MAGASPPRRLLRGLLVPIDGCTWLKGDALEAFVDCACKGPEVVEVA